MGSHIRFSSVRS